MVLKIGSKVLMKKVRNARTQWERTKGLMFEDAKKFDYALIFDFEKEGRVTSSLHMIFVFFPIDVVFLDKNKKVVDKTTMTPFMLNYTPRKASKYVIEMPAGKGRSVKIGSSMSW